MKLEYTLGKYYVDGIEIPQDQYNKYSQSLKGKYIQINTIKEDENNSEIELLKNKIKELEKKLEQFTSVLKDVE